jgi:hypothetical protein
MRMWRTGEREILTVAPLTLKLRSRCVGWKRKIDSHHTPPDGFQGYHASEASVIFTLEYSACGQWILNDCTNRNYCNVDGSLLIHAFVEDNLCMLLREGKDYSLGIHGFDP